MPKLLSEAQVEGYARDGYVSPIDVLSAAEAQAFRQDLEDWETQRGQAIDFPEKSKSYLLFNWADQLVHHPRILDAVEDVIGPDILVYHSTLFLKEAHTPAYVRWHQDSPYLYLSPHLHVTGITTNFINGPTVGAAELSVDVRRVGKGVSFAHVSLQQENQILAESVVTLGTLKEDSDVRYADVAVPSIAPLEECDATWGPSRRSRNDVGG